MISVSGLRTGYGRGEVLRGFDLEVPEGCVTALLGGNGAGKSSLLRVLTGELRLRSGVVQVLGLDPWNDRMALLQQVGYVPDRVELPAWMRVRDHARFVKPVFRNWDAAEARRLLEMFGLEEAARYRDLSKGQRVLENLAMAMGHRPRLLILDEPFAGLDPVARKLVIDGVFEALGESGSSVLFSSHNLVDVERCADRVAILGSGVNQWSGRLDDLRGRGTRLLVRRHGVGDFDLPNKCALESGADERELVLFCTAADAAALEGVIGALNRRADVAEVVVLGCDLEDLLISIGGLSKALIAGKELCS